jgi:hypothetical protein
MNRHTCDKVTLDDERNSIMTSSLGLGNSLNVVVLPNIIGGPLSTFWKTLNNTLASLESILVECIPQDATILPKVQYSIVGFNG